MPGVGEVLAGELLGIQLEAAGELAAHMRSACSLVLLVGQTRLQLELGQLARLALGRLVELRGFGPTTRLVVWHWGGPAAPMRLQTALARLVEQGPQLVR